MQHAVQQQLFSPELLPRKPYCSDDLSHGLKIRSLRAAMRRRYIQINPPHLIAYLCFDIDRSASALAHEQAGLAMPNVAVINKLNAHAHTIYALEVPVATTQAAREAPLRYLDALRRAYTAELKADRGYSGLIVKNPMHSEWRTLWGHGFKFSMQQLEEHLKRDLSYYTNKTEDMASVGLGRNCTLFDLTRAWAYEAIRFYRLEPAQRAKAYDAWLNECIDKVLQYNGDFTNPLSYAECKAIGKSIARYCWRNDLAAYANFIKKQSERGKKSGAARYKNSTEQQQPWKTLGISRATWYRRRKKGLLCAVDNPSYPLVNK